MNLNNQNTYKDLVKVGGDPDTSIVKLQECEGDCDSDSDCDTGLICFQRSYGEVVPGCNVGGVGDTNNYDYCYSTLAADVSGMTLMNDQRAWNVYYLYFIYFLLIAFPKLLF